MSCLIDALPGTRLPLATVTATLAQMDSATATDHSAELRASQMNLIVHFGKDTSVDEARKRFDIALRFTQSYPARIIVLCAEQRPQDVLEAKWCTQCYPTDSVGQMRCCEALILSYVSGHSPHLENQISIWLESDLPTYYWLHRVSASHLLQQYSPLIKNCNRVVYDSSVDGYRNVDWPDASALSDLACSRLLPVRQSIGQFLSAFDPEVLVQKLKTVCVFHPLGKQGEAQGLLHWLRVCLEACLRQARLDSHPTFKCTAGEDKAGLSLAVEWTYEDQEKQFRWHYNEPTHYGRVTGRFGSDLIEHPIQIRLLSPEKALAESLFYNV